MSIHYVDEEQISFQQNADPIFKDFDILVQGRRYRPFEFLRVLRNTKDGMQGVSVVEENSKLIQTAYETLVFEQSLVKKGGNKRGFLKSPKRLAKEAFEALKEAFRRSYQNGEENVLILNEGVEFQEASNTSVEMQLNENKVTNAGEFAKLFHISPDIMSGRGTETDVSSLARLAAIPLMTAIQCALNRDFLLEREKGEYYWAFDTKELLKGSMRDRFEAYKMALDANFFQVDEVRYLEDLEPLGFRWMKLGLEDVLFDPKTGKIFTPNTGQMGNMAEGKLEELPAPEAQGAGEGTPPSLEPQEVRGNPNHDPGNGRFTSGPGGSGGASTDLTSGENSGRISGGITDPDSDRAVAHAERYYGLVRSMTTDCKHIAENTGFSLEDIQKTKSFLFVEEHDLKKGRQRFDPDFAISESWRRLIEGKSIQPHDLTLLAHEKMERVLMKSGLSQSDAHKKTSAKYNYQEESKEYYDRLAKNQKRE